MADLVLPTTMQTLLHDQQRQTLSIQTTPLPTLQPREHLIKVDAVGLTATELLWTRPPSLNVSVPGVDVVGRIVVAPPSSKFQPGAEVYARTTFPRPGSAREYSVALEEELAFKPKTMSAVEAAAVPVSALTAWQALFDHAGLTPPDQTTPGQSEPGNQVRILINGASGGVGIWATQLAKAAGAYVIGTCRGPANVGLVRELGADEVLDYTVQRPQQWVEEDPRGRQVDLVLDCAGGTSERESWYTVKEGGQVISIVPPADMDYKSVLERPHGVSDTITGKFFVMHPDGECLGRVASLIDDGEAKAVVDSVWTLGQYEQAFAKVESGHPRGKVVLRIGEQKETRKTGDVV